MKLTLIDLILALLIAGAVSGCSGKLFKNCTPTDMFDQDGHRIQKGCKEL